MASNIAPKSAEASDETIFLAASTTERPDRNRKHTKAQAPTSAGTRKLRRKFSAVALRHAISGPTPTRNRSASAQGMLTRLKIGGPILTLRPLAASARRGDVGGGE